MAKIDFRPNKGKKVIDTGKPVKVYLRYSIGRKLDFNASIKDATVLIDDWDSKKKRVKNRSAILNGHAINEKLDNLESHFATFTNNNIRNGFIPSYQDVKKHFQSFGLDNSKTDEKITLLKFIDEFINRPRTKIDVSGGTIKTYKGFYNLFKQFNDKVYNVDFCDVDDKFYTEFIQWCEKKNYTKNTVGKQVKTLKKFMRRAVKEKLTDNTAFLDFTVPKEEVQNVYLNLIELQSLQELDLTHSKKHSIALDLFLIGAYTGLRVSDYNNLNETNIKRVEGVKMLQVNTQKTAKKVVIPLHPTVDNILTKYNGNPPKMADQTINKLIKELCESAGIDEVVYLESTKGGKNVQEKFYKYQLVKTHTARRSFCTNAYNLNMNVQDIMEISGHTSLKTFMNYVKTSQEQKALKMSEHPMFKALPKMKVV